MPRYIKHMILIFSLFMLLQPTNSFAATINDLVFYRGVYDLQLNSTTEKSIVTGFAGRMVYEFSSNQCEGFSTKFRLVSNIDVSEVTQTMNDQQLTTLESADGKKFNFTNKNFIDQDLTKEVVGQGEVDENGLKINVTKPKTQIYNLEKAMFPSEHTLAIINHALDKNYIFNTNLYDGSEDGDKIIPTNVIIGKKITAKIDDETKIMGELGKQAVWPVNIAYYDDSENPDGLPVYKTSFLLYENGITRDLILDYGDFSIKGKLVKLELLPKQNEKCKQINSSKK